jgi:hypothetical protein
MRGFSAAGSSLTAGGIAAVLAASVVVVLGEAALEGEVVVDDAEFELEDPHPASARTREMAARSSALCGTLDLMFLLCSAPTTGLDRTAVASGKCEHDCDGEGLAHTPRGVKSQ